MDAKGSSRLKQKYVHIRTAAAKTKRSLRVIRPEIHAGRVRTMHMKSIQDTQRQSEKQCTSELMLQQLKMNIIRADERCHTEPGQKAHLSGYLRGHAS